jgi:hypothetical protein
VSGPVPVWLDPAVQARALAVLLARLGLAAEVVGDPAGAASPCVAVSGFAAGGVARGYVHAAQDQDGTWRWWLALPGGPGLEAGGVAHGRGGPAGAGPRGEGRAAARVPGRPAICHRCLRPDPPPAGNPP